MSRVEHLLLFDIDGTLLTTERAGLDALSVAIEAVLGIGEPLRGVAMAGNTDLAAIGQVCARAGRPFPDREQLDRLRARYLAELSRRLVPGQGRLMPGVPALLAALAGTPGVLLGLVTGNIEPGARCKLQAYGIDSFFGFGGFGCDSPHRADLVGLAMQRARVVAGGAVPVDRTVVIGDTEHDIASCTPWGVRSVGVATGPRTVEQLAAAGAHRVLPDFSSLSETLNVLLA